MAVDKVTLTCDSCGITHSIDSSKIPDGKTVTGKCKCGQKILINTKSLDTSSNNENRINKSLCPNCKEPKQEESEECHNCGIIYKKFETRERREKERKLPTEIQFEYHYGFSQFESFTLVSACRFTFDDKIYVSGISKQDNERKIFSKNRITSDIFASVINENVSIERLQEVEPPSDLKYEGENSANKIAKSGDEGNPIKKDFVPSGSSTKRVIPKATEDFKDRLSMKWVYIVIFLVLFQLIILSRLHTIYGFIHWNGPYSGQVIDAETGEPVAGANVAGVWDMEYYVIKGLSTFADAAETVTDKNGMFTLPRVWVVNQWPFGRLKDMELFVFKPQYDSYPPAIKRKMSKPEMYSNPIIDGMYYIGHSIVCLPKQKCIVELNKTISLAEREKVYFDLRSDLSHETTERLVSKFLEVIEGEYALIQSLSERKERKAEQIKCYFSIKNRKPMMFRDKEMSDWQYSLCLDKISQLADSHNPPNRPGFITINTENLNQIVICNGPNEVLSAGQCWMGLNLGASRVAISSTDSEAYGNLYQWGRDIVGYESRTSPTTRFISDSDIPGFDNFILSSKMYVYDWRSPQNDNLWQGVKGTNNPCPTGFRLPTETEWETERASWLTNDASGAFNSPLKLVVAGSRHPSDGSLRGVGSHGYYWSSTVDGFNSRYLYFGNSFANIPYQGRSYGFSVRCIRE